MLTTYLTVQEVAALLKVSPKTIYRWASQDATMPALRIGGVVRFPPERLERWLRERGPSEAASDARSSGRVRSRGLLRK